LLKKDFFHLKFGKTCPLKFLTQNSKLTQAMACMHIDQMGHFTREFYAFAYIQSLQTFEVLKRCHHPLPSLLYELQEMGLLFRHWNTALQKADMILTLKS
jgi:hypothetical protein